METYVIQFEFVSTDAQGDIIKRTITVKADSPRQAENIAWNDRGIMFGLFGTDNALDCRAIPDD